MAAFPVVPAALATPMAAARGEGIERFLRALAAFGLAVWAMTEGLSLLEGFRFWPCWFVGAWWWLGQFQRRSGGVRKRASTGQFDLGGWFGLLCVVGVGRCEKRG